MSTTEPTEARECGAWVTASGSISVLLGVVVVTGWYLGSPRIVQLHPSWAPMQFNAALAFLACGIGVIARSAGLHRVTLAAGVFAALLGSLTLAEYLLSSDIGLDELFFDHSITTQTSHPGRMAPNAALCFALVGTCLIVEGNQRWWWLAGPVLGALGSIVTAIAAVALTGYATGLSSAYGWGELTRMAVHTAAGFVVLGAGLTWCAWQLDTVDGESVPAWLPAPVALGVSALAVLLWQSLIVHNEQQTRVRLTDAARAVEHTIERRLSEMVDDLSASGSRWVDIAAHADSPAFIDGAHWLVPHTRFEAFGWIDRDGSLRTWLARVGNDRPASAATTGESIVLDPTVRMAMRTGHARVSDGAVLPSGAPGLLAAVQVGDASNSRGTAVALIDSESLLLDATNALAIAHAVTILDGTGRKLFSSRATNEHYVKNMAARSAPSAHGVRWEAHVEPTRAWLAANASRTPDVVLVAGLLLALALARTAYHAYKAGRGAADLRTSEARWQHLFEHAPGAHMLADRRGGIIDLNLGAIDMLGDDRDDVIGRHVLELGIVGASEEERLREAWEGLRSSGPSVSVELTMSPRPRQQQIVELHLYPTRIDDEDLVLCVFHDVTERRRAMLELRRRLDFERVVSGLASAFINLPADGVDAEICNLLERVAAFAHADRACVVELREGETPLRMTHEWNVPGQRSFADEVARYKARDAEPLTRGLAEGEPLHIEDVGAFAPRSADENDWMNSGEVGAFVAVPIREKDGLRGYVAFSSRVPGGWDSDHIAVMQVAAEIVLNALARQDSDATLRASEERFQQIATNIEQVFFVHQIDPPKVLYASPALERIWGIPLEQALAEPRCIAELMSETDAERVLDGYAAATHSAQEMEYRITRPDGSQRWLHTRAFPVTDESGRVYRVAGITADITARKRAEQRLADRAEQEAIVRRLAAGLIAVDLQNIDAAIEEGLGDVARMLGVERAAIYMLSVDLERASNTHEWCADAGTSMQARLQDFECSQFAWLGERLRNGEPVTMRSMDDLPPEAEAERYAMAVAGIRSRIQLPLRHSNGRVGALVFGALTHERDWPTDVVSTLEVAATVFASALERKLADEKVDHYRDKLRVLASEISLAEERERRRIAADLHDRTIQNLGLCRMKLGELHAELDGSGDMSSLDSTRRLLQDTIHDARTLAFEISSPVLYELGFRAAVDWLAERMEDMHGVHYEVVDDGAAKPLDDDVAVVLFQAVRELMANVGKHAGAERAVVRLSSDGHTMRIEVEDDGKGFDAARIGPRLDEASGFGLFSIRERSRLIGGDLEIDSRAGGGTRIVLRTPLGGQPPEREEARGATT